MQLCFKFTNLEIDKTLKHCASSMQQKENTRTKCADINKIAKQ
jgi:hypothetical protein